MMEYVETSRMRYINENDRRAVNKAPGRNRSRKWVLHRSVRAARAYAALLASDGLLFRGILLGQPGAQKQRHTNGWYCGCEEYAPKLAGSRGWHQAPSGSFNPKDIFTQSWRTRLTSRPKLFS